MTAPPPIRIYFCCLRVIKKDDPSLIVLEEQMIVDDMSSIEDFSQKYVPVLVLANTKIC